MSVNSVKVGDRVQIKDKDCQGTVAFTGHPSFAAGKWIGVILDEPKGKNNGTVKGQSYFKCADNYGMFVRPIQLKLLDDAGNVLDTTTNLSSTLGDDGGASRARSRLNSTIVQRKKNEPTAVRRKTSPVKPIQQHTEKLSNSRLSLAGSRSQLSSPSVENLTGSQVLQQERKETSLGSESGIPVPTTIKRASFVEKTPSTSSSPGKRPKAHDDRNDTGFVETLKPHFVPGQAMAGSMSAIGSSVEEKLSNLQLSQENENLKSQVTDLNEKVEILRIKRLQDKEKMKEFEKTKLQLESLLEFKSKVMESQASLQRELQRARQETREAQLARGNYQDEMADLAETVEMATLDKEMAEEKAETLQIELEQLKEKLEEKTLDLEILKTEMSERSGGGSLTSGIGPTNYEIKQLEQQNGRLRETLVKMRDLSAHEKHEFQKLQKDLDQKKSEILELGRTKEKLSARVEEMEHQISDLQEQVDAALGAEEMVELLGERKMILEERVIELEEAVSDLEALQDMSDQLAESSKELELELREELDMALGSTRDAQRHRDAALETLADRELTITKFRELTIQLQEQCLQLQNRVQSNESMQSVNGSAEQQLAEILDFQKTFAETRAQTKAVDLELRRLEIEEAKCHVKYLISFMPPAFMIRGGDHDAIMTLLLIPRMTQKTEILISQVRDKYNIIEKIDRTGLLKGHFVAQYAFRSRLCGHMYALQTILGLFEQCLNSCNPDILLKVGAIYPEMAAQEKSLDFFIQLAKKDQLDENIPMDNIEKCSAYFSTMFIVLFGDGSMSMANQAKLVINGTRTLSSLCDAISTEAIAIKCLLDGEIGDIGLLCQHVETNCEVIQQHLNSARRRVPRDQAHSGIINNLGLDNDWTEQFSNCYQNSVKITKTLQDLLKNVLQTIAINGDIETGLCEDKIKEIAAISTEKIYDTDDLGPVATIKSSLLILQQMAANLAQKMAEAENELAISGQTSNNQEKIDLTKDIGLSPIKIRAQIVRKESEETKILGRKLETRDVDIREARIALREKQEELSEMVLRKELAEKRLATQQHEHELNIEKLKRKLEESQNQLKRKEKEFEETMDHLQTDIDSLESEKGQLKEKLKTFGKKVTTPIAGIPSANIEGSTSIISGDGSGNSLSSSGAISSGPINYDNRLLIQEISALKEALNFETKMKKKLLANSLNKQLDALDPITEIIPTKTVDDEIKNLQKKKNQLVKEMQNILIFPNIPDLSHVKKNPESPLQQKHILAYQLFKRQHLINELALRTDELSNEIIQMKITKTIGGQTPSDFAVFPTIEMASAMREEKQIRAAQIKIPYDGPGCVQPINVGPNELRKIHSLLSY